jgi:hypothetical protein
MQYLNKRLPLLIILLTSLLIYTNGCLQKPTTLSLWNLLDHYGYQRLDQKKALEHLCQEAGILSQEQSFQDRFPQRKEKNDLLQDLTDFVTITQKHFLLRSGTQERWEVKPVNWMQVQKPETVEALSKLDVVAEIPPQNKTPDVVCILGATFKTMATRIGYVENLYNGRQVTPRYLVLLAGQRKSTVGVDGTEAELARIAQHQGVTNPTQLTETHLIQEAYQASTLYNKLPTHVIDTPAGNLPRPTTETTTLEFIKWLRQHPEVKTVLFISNQPFVNYQKAVITEVFISEKFEISFEVVGAASAEPLNIQKLVESIGSYIWAKTPQVLREVGFQLTDNKAMKQLK